MGDPIPPPDDFDPYSAEITEDDGTKMNKERIADAATGGAWALWGLSLTTLNEVLTTLSLLAAIFCSICAGLYYLRKRRNLGGDGR